jgi:hypothetical protein
MTNQEINKTIAEYCGWTECRLTIKGAGGGTRNETAYGKPPARKYEAPCPDYTRDLNAMHEAEKVLERKQWHVYADNIDEMHRKIELIHATARQRAEAFLRTLGKWKE